MNLFFLTRRSIQNTVKNGQNTDGGSVTAAEVASTLIFDTFSVTFRIGVYQKCPFMLPFFIGSF